MVFRAAVPSKGSALAGGGHSSSGCGLIHRAAWTSLLTGQPTAPQGKGAERNSRGSHHVFMTLLRSHTCHFCLALLVRSESVDVAQLRERGPGPTCRRDRYQMILAPLKPCRA